MNSKQIAEKLIDCAKMTAVDVDILEVARLAPDLAKAHLEALELLKAIKAHYQHPNHDHNWAYWVHKQVDKFLARHDDKETGE